jgi:hypothetical protein
MKCKKRSTLILTILVDLYKKKINYRPRWLKHLTKTYELSKMSNMQNVGDVKRLKKGLKKLCTLVWTLHVPLLVHFTMLSPKHLWWTSITTHPLGLSWRMTSFLQHPELAFVLIWAKGQGYGWLLNHLSIRSTHRKERVVVCPYVKSFITNAWLVRTRSLSLMWSLLT